MTVKIIVKQWTIEICCLCNMCTYRNVQVNAYAMLLWKFNLFFYLFASLCWLCEPSCVCVLPDALCYVMWVLDIQVYVMYVKYNGRTLLFVFDNCNFHFWCNDVADVDPVSKHANTKQNKLYCVPRLYLFPNLMSFSEAVPTSGLGSLAVCKYFSCPHMM